MTAQGEFGTTLRDIWDTRPVRITEGAKIAGVAEGIARRYSVDSTLVRVILIAATFFGGLGLAIYLLGWLLLPLHGDENSALVSLLGKGGSRTSVITTVVLIIACWFAIPLSFSSVSPLLGSSALVLILLTLALWALYQRTSTPPPGTSVSNHLLPLAGGQGWGDAFGTDAAQPASVVATGPAPTAAATGAGSAAPEAAATASDPLLGAAPPAGPSPGPIPSPGQPDGFAPLAYAPAASRRTSRSWGPSIAMFLATALVCLFTFLPTLFVLPSLTVVGAIQLLIIGTAILIGAFFRRGYFLALCAAPVLAGTLLMAAVAHDTRDEPASIAALLNAHDYSTYTTSDVRLTVRTAADLDRLPPGPHYGDLIVDASQLTLDAPTTVAINNVAGNVQVTLPGAMEVEVTCLQWVNSARCPDYLAPGSAVDPDSSDPDSADPAAAEPTTAPTHTEPQQRTPLLTLTIMNRLGDIEVLRHDER